MSTPSVAEIRSVAQPDWLLRRHGAEHWAGRLYMRRLSPYLTRLLVGTPVPADAVTGLMIPVGIAAALLLTVPGPAAAAGTVVLVQLQLLLDCSDGEIARWRRTSSARGVYLDQLGHYATEAAIPAALGVRAAAGWGSIDGWTALGLLVSVLVLVLKAETHLVGFARARAGRPALSDAPEPEGGRRRLPGVRPFQAVEASLLALAAAVADALAGTHLGTRVLLCTLAAFGVVAVAGHLAAVLRSDRLR